MFLRKFWKIGFRDGSHRSKRQARHPLGPSQTSAEEIRVLAADHSGLCARLSKGPEGSAGLARLIDSEHRHETTLGPADDALDADGERVLDYAQAQTKARSWLTSLDAEGKAGPYTINHCLDDYIADYKRRGGKAPDRLKITADALIRPQLGAHVVKSLTAAMIRKWHLALAEAPARLRTRKKGAGGAASTITPHSALPPTVS
jgi:hypothetical protein